MGGWPGVVDAVEDTLRWWAASELKFEFSYERSGMTERKKLRYRGTAQAPPLVHAHPSDFRMDGSETILNDVIPFPKNHSLANPFLCQK
jgi:hypothetical protein